MDIEDRLKRLENAVSSLIEYINTYNINTVRRDYDSWQRRQEALHRHRLNFEYTVSEQVYPNTRGEEEGEDEIDVGSI